jgi:hypothetical protein
MKESSECHPKDLVSSVVSALCEAAEQRRLFKKAHQRADLTSVDDKTLSVRLGQHSSLDVLLRWGFDKPPASTYPNQPRIVDNNL